ncbi:hypothetical protein HAX54_032499, partial [Datura stramonium]|nr:hypothetical protein [Datura stramonium]
YPALGRRAMPGRLSRATPCDYALPLPRRDSRLGAVSRPAIVLHERVPRRLSQDSHLGYYRGAEKYPPSQERCLGLFGTHNGSSLPRWTPSLTQRLSGADRKKLRRSIRDRFSNASDAILDFLLPPKAELAVSKYPNRVLVYGLEGDCPLFFDVDGRVMIYSLQLILCGESQNFCLLLCSKGVKFLLYARRVDLMFPGISILKEGFPSFSAGEPWAVKGSWKPCCDSCGDNYHE